MDRQTRVFADARSRWTVLIGGRFAWLADPASVRSFVERFGVAAPLAFVLLQATQVVIAPIPGQVLALASGWLFGLVWGTVYSIIGATLGSYVAFRLARRYGRPFVDRAIDPTALDRFDDFSNRRGYLTLLVLFLVPGLPDDVICFVAGTTALDIKRITLRKAPKCRGMGHRDAPRTRYQEGLERLELVAGDGPTPDTDGPGTLRGDISQADADAIREVLQALDPDNPSKIFHAENNGIEDDAETLDEHKDLDKLERLVSENPELISRN